ncbi:MAG: dephospho-CoA kinase [Gemmatimonadota bacterium]
MSAGTDVESPVRKPASRALRVGLTGNVASGKSTVAAAWRQRGIPVVDADQLARDAVVPGSPGLERVTEEFGDSLLTPDGALDRAALGEVVFADAEARGRLEAILHPIIAESREEWCREREAEGHRIVVSEIPLLFEVGLTGDFDRVVVVDAPREERLRRLVQERDLSHAAAEGLMLAQGDPREKRERADHVIFNTGSRAELEERALRLLDRLQEEVNK